MNKAARSLAVLIFVGLTAVAAVAQTVPQPTREDMMRDNLERRMNDMRNLDTLARKQAELEKAKPPNARYYRPELTKALERRLEVGESVSGRFASVLSKPGTGIVRLIEQSDCSGIQKASKAADCFQENANIREFANAFSFREGGRAHFGSSDLAMAKGHLVGGRRSVQTILVPLRETDLEAVGPDTPDLAYLFDFKPAEDAEGMDAQFEELRAGMTVANFIEGKLSARLTYSKTVKVEPGAVYALRAIGYRSSAVTPGAKDSDVVVVFRVVETDGRGGATILWKEISRKPGVVMKEADREPTDGK